MNINHDHLKSVAKVAISKNFNLDEMYEWLMEHSSAFRTLGMDERGEYMSAMKPYIEMGVRVPESNVTSCMDTKERYNGYR